MAQELTMNAKDFLTLENLQNIINVTNGYLDRVKPIFMNKFKTNNKISDGRSISQIINHNRSIFYFKDIISEKGWSEIKYGFIFQNPSIYVGLFVAISNNDYKAIIEESNKLPSEFNKTTYDTGVSIFIKKDISQYLNDEQADSKITDWYKDTFDKFGNFIKNTPNLNWKINVA